MADCKHAKKFKKLVNMSPAEIRKWHKDPRAKCYSEAATRKRLPRIAKLKAKPTSKWTANDCKFAGRVVNFNSRMDGARKKNGCTPGYAISLRNWGRKVCKVPKTCKPKKGLSGAVVRRKKKQADKYATCKPLKWRVEDIRFDKWAPLPDLRIQGYVKGDDKPVAKGRLSPRRRLGPDDEHILTGYTVKWSSVRPQYRRCGYGTQLYEKLRDVSCQAGVRLRSDFERTEFSDGFWKKQTKKGRARCIADISDRQFDKHLLPQDATCGVYEMKEVCPRDRSLAMIKKGPVWGKPAFDSRFHDKYDPRYMVKRKRTGQYVIEQMGTPTGRGRPRWDTVATVDTACELHEALTELGADAVGVSGSAKGPLKTAGLKLRTAKKKMRGVDVASLKCRKK